MAIELQTKYFSKNVLLHFQVEFAIYKRYKGRRLKRTDADWDEGTWWIEFSLQGQYIHRSVPGARTLAQAQRAESQIREAIYERRYDPGKKLFSEFVDETFLPWSRANKRSYREDEQRSVTLKGFFGEKHLRDIRDSLGHTSVRMTSVYTHQTPLNLCRAVNTLTNAKLGKVVRFPRKKRDRSTKQIAPSSRHLAVEQLSTQQPDAVSVRQLAS